MNNQAKNGHELETELKLIITKEQYNILVSFISNQKILNINMEKINYRNIQTKEREYRDFDTYNFDLQKNHCSLTARKRISDYFVTAKIPTKLNNTRYEYNTSISTKEGSFYLIDFISMPLEPIKKITDYVKINFKDLKEVLRRKVITKRADLFIDDKNIAEIAIDKVIIESKTGNTQMEFHELEIEKRSSNCDINLIYVSIKNIFGPMPYSTYSTKYERALILIRL